MRCQLRYCSQDCQQHYWSSGHQENCEIIHRGGDAEQYHAEKKYKWAVAVAVEACAADTKGQTCYICLEGIHPETSEGLVRGCACRGAAGFAHVSCLARQAKVLVAEAEERDLDDDAFQARWRRWDTCGLCKQQYHGIVSCALGWACWKTYVGWDTAATLDDVREAITTLEDTERTARRVLGGAHPLTSTIERYSREARAALRARETPPPGSA